MTSLSRAVADKKLFAQVTFHRVELQVRRSSDLKERNKTGAKLFRGYHSHFTSNYRPSSQYECSVDVQWHSAFSRRSEKNMHAVL